MKLSQVKTSTEALKKASGFQANQTRIERMQLAIASKKASYDRKVQKGITEIASIKKRAEQAVKLGIRAFASDFTPLLTIYKDGGLDKVTLKDFKLSYAEKIAKFVAKLPDNLVTTQEPIVTRYYNLQAEHSMQGVKNITAFLEAKGLLKAPKQSTVEQGETTPTTQVNA